MQNWNRRQVGSGAPWEAKVGYSRAVRVGPLVSVGGTVAVDGDGNVVAPGDAYGQAVAALEKIELALGEVGARLADVTRTRMYVTDIARWEEVGRAHGEYFGDVRPVATMLEVAGLIGEEFLVEIEVEGVVLG